jgi:hypothetical protein
MDPSWFSAKRNERLSLCRRPISASSNRDKQVDTDQNILAACNFGCDYVY